MEELILKYEKAKQSQIDLKQQTPLNNAVQHQLLDQNIHIFDGIINDLRALASRSSVPQANELLPHVIKSVCGNCNTEVEPIPLGHMCPNCACDM